MSQNLQTSQNTTTTTTTTTTPTENVNLTLNHINKLLMGVNLAQSRGAYTFDDSAELAETVKLVTKLIKFNMNKLKKIQKNNHPSKIQLHNKIHLYNM